MGLKKKRKGSYEKNKAVKTTVEEDVTVCCLTYFAWLKWCATFGDPDVIEKGR